MYDHYAPECSCEGCEEQREERTPRLTRRQAAIIGLYTGVTLGPFEDIQEYASELVGNPVSPATMALMAASFTRLAKDDLMTLVAEK